MELTQSSDGVKLNYSFVFSRLSMVGILNWGSLPHLFTTVSSFIVTAAPILPISPQLIHSVTNTSQTC